MFRKTGSALLWLSLGMTMLPVHAREATAIRFYNWTDYIEPTVLEEFTKESGIRVEYTTFETSEELEEKILSKKSGYDLVVSSATFLARQRAKGFFQPLQKSSLSNYKLLDSELLKKLQQSDPDNRFGVPYLWGTNIFAYNKKMVTELVGNNAPLTSWKLVLDPESAKKLAPCGIALLDSPSEVLPEVLRLLGALPNSQNPMDYYNAERLISRLKPSIRYFGGDEIVDDLANGKICVGVSYSGDLAQARSQGRDNGHDIVLVNPQEGAEIWTDLMAIPADSNNLASVHRLIDFLLRPQIMARISNAVEYANPVPASWPLVDEAIRSDPALFPNTEAQKKLYSQYLLTDAIEKIQQRVWKVTQK